MPRFSPIARWALIVFLVSASVYVHLWPRDPSRQQRTGGDSAAGSVEAVLTTDRELEHFAAAPQLASLYLAGPRVTDAGLKQLTRFTRLENLSLRDMPITEADLNQIAGLSHLEGLSFRHVDFGGALSSLSKACIG